LKLKKDVALKLIKFFEQDSIMLNIDSQGIYKFYDELIIEDNNILPLHSTSLDCILSCSQMWLPLLSTQLNFPLLRSHFPLPSHSYLQLLCSRIRLPLHDFYTF